MLLGSALGQVLAVALSPVLTRLFSPTDFGTFAVFAAVTGTLGIVASLRLDAAVPLPRTAAEAAAVAWSGVCAALAIAGCATLLWAVLGTRLAAVLGAPSLGPVAWLIGLTVLLIAVNQVLSGWLVREQRYGALGIRNGAQGAGTVAAQLSLGLNGRASIGLLLGMTIGHIAAFAGLLTQRGLLRQRRPSSRQMRQAVSRYRRFPLVASWSALLNVLGQQAPLLAVSALYGAASVGLLALTMRILAGPATLLGQAVAQVFRGETSAKVRAGDDALASTIRRTASLLLMLGLLPTILIIAFGPHMFSIAFGDRWRASGDFARLLALAFLAQFVVSPVSQTLLVLERLRLQLVWDAMRLALTLAAPVVAFLAGRSVMVAVAALAGAYVVSYVALYWLCIRAASSIAPQHEPVTQILPEPPDAAGSRGLTAQP